VHRTPKALFGQATYSVSSRVSLTGGVRYTDERKDLDNTGGVYRLGTTILADPTSFYDYVDNATYRAWTPKVSIHVQASRDTFVYASATRGFKSGGFNPTATRPGLAFNPEFAWSYEGGLKRTLAGGRPIDISFRSLDRDAAVGGFSRRRRGS
jgi:iron complex outermembrane receptor protein